jgi:pilus assembly protein CpaC
MKLQQSMYRYPAISAVNFRSLTDGRLLTPLPSLLAATALCAIAVLTANVPAANAQVLASVRPAEMQQSAASNMTVTMGKSALLRLPSPVTRISVGNPMLADVMLVNSNEVYVLGRFAGTTNIIVWSKGKQTEVISVIVILDAEALQRKLQELMPDEQGIIVSTAADSLVLSGMVSDSMKADRAVALADAYVRVAALNQRTMLMQSGNQAASSQQGMMAMMGQGGAQGGGAESMGAGQGLGTIKVINLLQVGNNQQVMLEVKIIEINRTLAEKLGFDFNRAASKAGDAFTKIMTGALPVAPGTLFKSPVEGGGTGPFLIDAEREDNLIKILAEPNIVAISGQEASFLVGGEIMIPVPQSLGMITLIGKQFGVGLKFTPTVLAADRVNLVVAPEVSELVGFNTISTTSTGGVVSVPTFTTRRISTTVQLRDGQSLAIGGLLKDNFKEQIKRFPMLGEIAILGSLFRSTNFLKDKTEMMVIVTPRLIKPLPPGYNTTPADAFIEPSRSNLFLDGTMEGSPPKPSSKEAPVTGVQPPATRTFWQWLTNAPATATPVAAPAAEVQPPASSRTFWQWLTNTPATATPAAAAPATEVQPQAESLVNPAEASGFQMK